MRKLLVALLLLALLGAGAALWLHSEIMRSGEADLGIQTVENLLVEPGDHLGDVFAQLHTRGLISDVRAARLYARLTEAGAIQAGEFELRPGDNLASVLKRLAAGEVVQHQFTIVPGWTVREMLDNLMNTQVTVTPGIAPEGLPLMLNLPDEHAEGWFLPDTYSYVRGETDLDVLARTHAAMLQALDAAWQGRADELPYSSPRDLLIAASLVEKETGHPDDRGLVASVFVRRLAIGMRLQTDPTIIYGLGDAFDGNLTRRHLRTPGPYNTYLNHGLPPTPIALPGQDALNAAAHPEASEYLYFVARGDGTSQFSRTLAEHNAAVRRYQLGH